MPVDLIWKSQFFLLLTIFFLDGGHVYSTYLESLADPNEFKNSLVWKLLISAFLLNLLVHYFITEYFFTYIFFSQVVIAPFISPI